MADFIRSGTEAVGELDCLTIGEAQEIAAGCDLPQTLMTTRTKLVIRPGSRLVFLGGSKSGKSAAAEHAAERIAEDFGRSLVYCATMIPGGDPENAARIDAHRHRRQDKGYLDRECYRDIGSLTGDIPPGSVVLLDCLGNLCANEMFVDYPSVPSEDLLFQRVMSGLNELSAVCSAFVAVGNDVFSDALAYGAETAAWRRLTGRVQESLAEQPNTYCFEVSAGFTLYLGKKTEAR